MQRYWIVVAVLLTALYGGFPVRAEHYSFVQYGPNEGLNSTVKQVVQDGIGFLWVGTSNGLFRYDGARFQRFGPSEGLPSSAIRALHVASDGTVWVITPRGLVHFDNGRFTLVDTGGDPGIPPESLSSSMDSTPDGRLYLASRSGLLVGSPLGSGDRYSFRLVPGGPGGFVNGVFADIDGAVWYGCGRQLCRAAGGAIRVFGPAEGLPADRWFAMLRDRQGTLWIRGEQHLYVSPREGRFEPRDKGLSPSSNSALGMTLDRTGRVLVSTDTGLAIWQGDSWQVVGMAQGLESETVTSVLQDREGSVWIGTWGAGLARWVGFGEWTNWTRGDGMANSLVWAIQRHPSGDLWVGTDNGLIQFRGNLPLKTWSTANGLPGSKIKALQIDGSGAVWVGMTPGGVARIDPAGNAIRRFGAAAGLEDDRVIAMLRDAKGDLYVSTNEGLFRATAADSDARFEHLVPPGSRPHDMFFRLSEDRAGRLWVGSTSGLYSLDRRGQWTRFSTADGLRTNGVTNIVAAEDGSLWFGYREPLGLTHMWLTGGRPRLEHYSQKDGLVSDYVVFTGSDDAHNLWIGTDNGVDVLSKGRWYHHNRNDGMVWNDCAANAFLAESGGAAWIGTLKGLSHYQPSGVTMAAVAPPIIILKTEFGARPANPERFAEVSFRDHDFRVFYAGLTYRDEKATQFRYMLEGLDEGWTETMQREVRYASLPPGRYTFRVVARAAGGLSSARPADFSFRILPPWWRSWWFRGLMLSGLGALVVFGVRSRILIFQREQKKLEKAVQERTAELESQKTVVERQKGEIEELLEKSRESSRLKSEFLANMSHEIRTPMNGIIGLTEIVLSTALNEEQRDCLATVRGSADGLLTILNDILDFSKIEAGKLELAQEPFRLRECLSATLRVFARKARQKGLELTYAASTDVPEMVSGDSGRLRQIILNLVGNAIKFTERGSISVSVTRDEGGGPLRPDERSLLFTVRDTGIGISADKQRAVFDAFSQADSSAKRRQGGTGLGLAICRKLVGLMRGQIWVESVTGAGSAFYFTCRFETIAAPQMENAPDTSALVGRTAAVTIANPVTRRLVQDLLAGWRMLSAGASDAACDYLICDGEWAAGIAQPKSSIGTVALCDQAADPLVRGPYPGVNVRHVLKPLSPIELFGALSELAQRQPPSLLLSHADVIPQASEPLRILLVEDNHVNQRVAVLMLSRMGHQVTTADDGQKALDAIRREVFDIVLMDMQMPVIDGYEATRLIREAERQGKLPGDNPVPIIAMTAHAMAGDRELCLSAGMDDYLSKPIDSASLHRIIEKYRRVPVSS